MAASEPLKVLQVASSLFDWGGIERYVQYLADGLTERGHEVTVACPPDSPLDCRLDVPKVPLAVRGKYSPVVAAQYLRLFRQSSFHLAHVHFSPDFLMPAYAARAAGVPCIMTRHVSLAWKPHRARTYDRLFRHFIPVSDSVRRRLLESGIPDEKMTVAKAGCPALRPTEAPEQTRDQFGWPSDAFVASTFGRLVPEKGTDVFLRAVPGGVMGCVFGDGPEQAKLEGLAEGKDRRLMGRVENVADAMAACDVVVIPSVWEEAFPYSALEAMSLGRPIIGSDVGGLPEMVSPGVNGLLVPKGDAEALSKALSELAANRVLARTMGASGRERHRAEFTVPAMAARIEAVYRSTVG